MRACRLPIPAPIFGTACAAALLLASSASHADKPASGSLPRTDPFLARIMAAHPQSGWTSVIARLEGELTPQARTQLKALGADVYRRLPLIRSVSLRVPLRNLDKLAALPFVQHLSSDVMVTKTDEFTTAASGATTAWAAPYNLNGSGIGVAVVDSGIHEQHLDLCQYMPLLGGKLVVQSDRVTASANFVDKSNDPAPKQGPRPSPLTWNAANDLSTPTGSADDYCGHGTHVAGIIAGNGNKSDNFYNTHTFNGIAPKASLVNVRVLNSNGQGDVSTVVAGIQWSLRTRRPTAFGCLISLWDIL